MDNGNLDRVLDRMGQSRRIAGAARIVTLAVSIIASVTLPILGWLATRGVNTFDRMAANIETINLFIARTEERNRQRDAQLEGLAVITQRHSDILGEHEKRLTRIEVLRTAPPAQPYYPQ